MTNGNEGTTHKKLFHALVMLKMFNALQESSTLLIQGHIELLSQISARYDLWSIYFIY